MQQNRYFRNLDWWLVIAIFGLIGIGICLIASATHSFAVTTGKAWHVERQSLFLAIDLALVIFSLRFDYRLLKDIATPLYVFNIILLFAVMFLGHSQLGAQRWIQIGPLSIQPSEFSKAIMIVCLAAFLNKRLETLDSFTDYLPALAYAFVPFILVMKQPDLGTSLVFMAILLGMLLISGFKVRWLMYMSGALIALMPALWHILKEYQKNRIRVFLDPELDPFGAGYHVIQSKIAIGSGLLTGKGWFLGTQSQLNFLPENHTDFIFAVAGEEFGFIGIFIILLLYLIVIWRFVGAGDNILVSEMEHHSNIVPWQMLAERKGAEIRVLPFDEAGALRTDLLPSLVDERTRVVAVTQASNTLGTRPDLRTVVEAAHTAVLEAGTLDEMHVK